MYCETNGDGRSPWRNAFHGADPDRLGPFPQRLGHATMRWPNET